MKTITSVRVQYWVSLMLWGVNILAYIAAFFLPAMYDIVGIIFIAFFMTVAVRFIIIDVRERKKHGGSYSINPFAFYGIDKRLKLILILSTVVTVLSYLIHAGVILREGGPRIVDGVYWIVDHGKQVRQITEKEYLRLCMAEARMFIGQFLMFNAVFLAYFGEEWLSERNED